MALPAEAVGHDETGRHGADVVDLGRLDGQLGIGVEVGLVAEDAERQQHEVDVAVVEHRVDDRPVRGGVPGVEGHDLAPRPPSSSTSSAAVFAASGSRTARTTRRALARSRRRTTANPISEVPPSTSTDWGDPRASCMRLLLARLVQRG